MREKVTGGDHGIGAKFHQAGHPRLLCGLSRDQVQIRQMQYAQIRLRCGEGANGGAAQGEALGLPAGVCHGSEPGDEGGGEQAGAGCHATMMTRAVRAGGGKMPLWPPPKTNFSRTCPQR